MKHFFLTAAACLLLWPCHGQKRIKTLEELVDEHESGWDAIVEWRASAKNQLNVLPKDQLRADSSLYHLQLSTSSPVAAMVYSSGGILVDNGWIRILGSGSRILDRSLPDWNKGKSFSRYGEDPSFLLVADDVLGGFFAINAGGIDEYDVGKVFYFGPNKLKWETTGLGYNEFIVFCFSGDLEKFYRDFRWKGWQEEVKKLNGNEVISCYPLLWTDAGKNLARNRQVVSVQRQWENYRLGKERQPKKTVKRKNVIAQR